MIHEFIGPPGSGKTFFSKKKSIDDSIDIIEVSGKKEKFLLILQFIVRRPIFFIFLFFLIIKENISYPKLCIYKLKFIYLNIVAKEQKAMNSNEDVIVDEGFFQLILSIYDRKINIRELRIFRHFLKSERYHLILLEVDKKVRLDRMQKRGRLPRSDFGIEYIKKLYPIIDKNSEIVCKFIKDNYNSKVIKN